MAWFICCKKTTPQEEEEEEEEEEGVKAATILFGGSLTVLGWIFHNKAMLTIFGRRNHRFSRLFFGPSKRVSLRRAILGLLETPLHSHGIKAPYSLFKQAA